MRRGHNRFSALSDDLQPTVLDGTHGSDTESVVDALEFDLTRGDEVDQAPSTPRVGDAMQVDDDEAASQWLEPRQFQASQRKSGKLGFQETTLDQVDLAHTRKATVSDEKRAKILKGSLQERS